MNNGGPSGFGNAPIKRTFVHRVVDACKSVLRGLHGKKIGEHELDRAKQTLLMKREAETKSNAYWLGLIAHLQAASVIGSNLVNELLFIMEAEAVKQEQASLENQVVSLQKQISVLTTEVDALKTKDIAGCVKLWEITKGIVIQDYGQKRVKSLAYGISESEELKSKFPPKKLPNVPCESMSVNMKNLQEDERAALLNNIDITIKSKLALV
ncbi:hypothetical protein L2E82_14645 [Cichorium intybus]|uniref:Uncharacterized protein n=1 Tax=Cichorium intybus TaxID=13427 RepID=A0ACB9F010_CICIN|nr:hypothetical protein L2E82_14645 [Cichorium intybus]